MVHLVYPTHALSSVPIERYYQYESEQLDAKHEFFDGLIVARLRGTANHALLSGRVLRQLLHELRGEPGWQGFDSNMRVRPLAHDRVFYPDATLVEGDVQLDPRDTWGETVTNPTLVVEVIGRLTERTDYHTKLEAYKSIESLQSIVYVRHDRAEVEAWYRHVAGGWEREEPESARHLQVLPRARLNLEALYDGIFKGTPTTG